jgi:hypothetical protein
LRSIARCAVQRGFLRQPLRRQEPNALHAKFARHRQDELATHAWRLRSHLMYVHPDIDVWDKPATAGGLKIAPCCKCIKTSDHDIAAAQ